MRRLSLAVLALFALPLAARELPQDLSAYNPFAPEGPPVVLGGITPISGVNANAANGFAQIGEFAFVKIRGVAQSATGDLDPYDVGSPSTWFYVNDGTGGVAIAQSGGVIRSVAAGDSVEVETFVFTQRQSPLRGTRAIDHGAVFPGTITILATNRPLTPAVAHTAAEIVTNGDSYEGSLVIVSGLTLVNPAQWPAVGASAFVDVTDGTTTFRAYVDDETDIAQNSPPAGAFDLTGFVAQHDAAAPETGPFTTGHFLYPRGIADFAQGDGSGTATVTPTFALTGATGQTVTTTVTGQDVSLETIEIVIPATWTWDTPGDLTLSGPGFAGASGSFRIDGANHVAVVSNAAVTASSSGTLAIGSLTAPADVETSTFVVRTATPGGSPTPITASPQVTVVEAAQPGDIVINELYPVTITLDQGIERSEFIELHNVSGADLSIDGWTLQDVGRVAGCGFGARWAFPSGTMIPADGYAVVCRNSRDASNGAGFLVDFPSFPATVPLFEMYDSVGYASAVDDPTTPNMILRDPSATNDQIVLLGGANTNVGQCETDAVPDVEFPFFERILLRDALGNPIDLAEYRELGPCDEFDCGDGLSSPGDAYPYGPPGYRHTLGRDATSTDTDISRDDFFPSSQPTPGAANVPGDTVPPTIAAASVLSAVQIQVEYSEIVDEASALDPANYEVIVNGESYAVVTVVASPVKFASDGTVTATPQRMFFLSVAQLPTGVAGTLRIQGVRDLVIGGLGGNEIDDTASVAIEPNAAAICRIQEFDEQGFSPAVGDTVVCAGWVTLGDIPPVEFGDLLPVDRLSIWVQEPGGCGVNVFAFLPDDPVDIEADFGAVRRFGVLVNDFVQIRGTVTEFISSSSGSGAVTEIALLSGTAPYRLLARGLDGPAPLRVSTTDANDERLEGLLIRTEGTVINQNSLAAWIDDGSGSVQVFQNFGSIDLTRFVVGDRLDVTGVITQFDSSPPYLQGYELVPQNQEAVFTVDGGFASGGPSVTVDKAVLVPDLGETIHIETVAPQRSKLIVEIFDPTGRRIHVLYDGIGLGTVGFDWDGRDQRGAPVHPGVYLCRVRSVALDGGPVQNHTAPIVVGLRLNGGSR
ncbi:MAG: lamin tail domain-containing protein [bacterium]